MYIVHSICNTDGQSGIDRIRLMAKMTPQKLRLVPIEWREKYKLQIHQETGEVIEEWHTVALYIKGRMRLYMYDPSFNWTPTSEKYPGERDPKNKFVVKYSVPLRLGLAILWAVCSTY